MELYKTKLFTAQYDLEEWYEQLKELTFKTSLLAIDQTEAKAIRTKFWQKISKFSSSNSSKNEFLEFSEADKILLDLEEKIDDLLKSDFGSSSHVFCRLSTRSPKDSVLTSKEMDDNLQKFISFIPEGDNS